MCQVSIKFRLLTQCCGVRSQFWAYFKVMLPYEGGIAEFLPLRGPCISKTQFDAIWLERDANPNAPSAETCPDLLSLNKANGEEGA